MLTGGVSAVAWVPLAPLVVPEIGGPDAGDVDLARLRTAIAAAVAAVVTSSAQEVIVLAPTDEPADERPPATWSWHGFGVGEAPAAPAAVLPWPLGVGARLLDDAGWRGGRRYVGVTVGEDPLRGGGRAPVASREDAPGQGASGLVVLGDGSACRGENALGGDDPRAEGWDARLAGLLSGGDVSGLAALDRALGAELQSAAAVSFPVAARLLEGAGMPAPSRAEVSYRDAPYGVGYLVAVWTW